MVVSKAELEDLIERQEGKFLSVYLEVDQSQAANLNRGYLAALKDRLRVIEQQVAADQRAEFQSAAARVVQLVANQGPRGRTLVVFSEPSKDFLWSRELSIRLRTHVRWNDRPYVRPLIEALDEYERYAVVLADRQQARLFRVFLGEIEERKEVFAPVRIRQVKAVGMEHSTGVLNIQRKVEEHAHSHLKNVAETLVDLAGKHDFDRLVLAGPHEVTRELETLLPKHVQSLVIESIPMEMDASDQRILQETLAIQERVERQAEEKLVEQLITQGSKNARAVLELEPTLEAMRLGRILQLVYVFDLAAPGAQCSNCRSLFAETLATCSYCGASTRPVEDVVERLVELVVDSGGEAENVRGPAADRLRSAGRIGAFLRF